MQGFLRGLFGEDEEDPVLDSDSGPGIKLSLLCECVVGPPGRFVDEDPFLPDTMRAHPEYARACT